MSTRITGTLVAIAALLALAGTAKAQQVKIIGVDGKLAASGRVGEIRVWPGQVVSLTADEVWRGDGSQLEYGYRAVQDFVWSSTAAGGDLCDTQQDCRATSNFEVTDYGVNFYVPSDAPARIRIQARLRWSSEGDTVVLVNEAETGGATGYDSSLQGMGYWTTVGDGRVFVPYNYESDWEPYRHGYWYWSSYGWTWYSYDPWGEVTDHCGHWRHATLFGWVWAPDTYCAWRPAVVTFFHGPSYIGWYPYDPTWSWGYRRGYADGFDDGYWMGTWAARDMAGYGGHRPRPGGTVVAYADFYVPGAHEHPPARQGNNAPPPRVADMSRVRITDSAVVTRNFLESVRQGNVGPIPGGGKGMESGRQFIAERTGVNPVEAKMRPVNASELKGRGVTRMVPETLPHAVPAEYHGVRQTVVTAFGSRPGAGPAVRTSMSALSPAARVRDGAVPARGIAQPPALRDRAGGRDVNWKPRAEGRGDAGPGIIRQPVERQPIERQPIEREPASRGDVRARPEARPEVRPEVRPEARPEARPEVRPEYRPQVRPEARPEPRREVRPEPRPEVRGGFDARPARPQVRPEVREAPRPQVRPEVRPEVRPAPRPSAPAPSSAPVYRPPVPPPQAPARAAPARSGGPERPDRRR